MADTNFIKFAKPSDRDQLLRMWCPVCGQQQYTTSALALAQFGRRHDKCQRSTALNGSSPDP